MSTSLGSPISPSLACESSNSSKLALSLCNVSKAYKHFRLKRVSLQLAQGSVMGLIGPNGAGKSTTMRMLMGFVHPDEGEIEVFGRPLSSVASHIKRDIGYFADDVRMYKGESISWHMQLVRSLYPSWDDNYAAALLERFGLIADQRVKGLSHGQRVKAMLLLILSRRPKLLILDEPTNGLDPVAKQEVLTELMRIVEDDSRSIIYSSHNTQDVEQISDNITFIDRGEVIASQSQDDFLSRWRRIRIHVAEHWKLPGIEGLRVESVFRSLRVLSHDRFDESVVERLQQAGATIEAIEPMTLEEIFVSVVMRGREGTAK